MDINVKSIMYILIELDCMLYRDKVHVYRMCQSSATHITCTCTSQALGTCTGIYIYIYIVVYNIHVQCKSTLERCTIVDYMYVHVPRHQWK